MDKTSDQILAHKGLRVTSVRRNILSLFVKKDIALSKQDIEERLPNLDRITLYRTLRSFEDHGVIHLAFTDTQESKYALCATDCDSGAHYHQHAHFHCEDCGMTRCVDTISPPHIQQVDGMPIQEVELILKGQCQDCTMKEPPARSV